MSNIIFLMSGRNWAMDVIRSLFGWLDSAAYFLFSAVMQLIFDVVSVTSHPAFNNFYDGIHSRIYSVIAIYMLFKITISMLTYLVNPDSVNDKERGMGKMATRVVVSLIMLIAFPTAFKFMYKIQPHILEALPRVILGTESTTATEDGTVSNTGDFAGNMTSIGDQIAFDTYNGVWFNYNCADGKSEDGSITDQSKCFNPSTAGLDSSYTVGNAVSHINDPVEGDTSTYKYDYFPLMGFITGIIMSIILLGFCVDISIRVFKLIILQILAPIPIISYIDPKSSKDGAFSKWIKMLGSVYLELFIKMAIIYFVILVIKELITNHVIFKVSLTILGQTTIQSGSFARFGMISLALIIGLLFFAKEAPKFIADALGVKMNENSKLFGGLGKIMAAGSLAAGTIGSGIASGRASYMSDQERGKTHNAARLLKNIGAGFVGAASGFGTGANAALNAKDHYAKAAMDAMAKRNSTALAAGASGSTFFGRVGSTLMGLTTGETLAAEGDRKIKALENFNKALDAIGNRAKSEMVKHNWTYGDLGDFTEIIGYDNNGKAITVTTSGISANYKSFMAAKNAAAAAGKTEFDFIDNNNQTHKITMQSANMQEGVLLKNNENNYIKQTIDISNAHYDSVTAALVSDAEAKAVPISSGDTKLDSDINSFYVNGKFKVSSRDSIKKTQDAISMDSAKTQRDNETNKANDRFSSSGGK